MDISKKTILAINCCDGLSIVLYHNNLVIDSLHYNQVNLADIIVEKINDIFIKNNVDFFKLDMIYVVNGPGSFTAIRSAVAVVNTMAFALKIPIFAINHLQLLSASFLTNNPSENPDDLILTTMSIGSSNVVVGLFNNKAKQIMPPTLVEFDKLSNLLYAYKDNNFHVIGLTPDMVCNNMVGFKFKSYNDFNNANLADIFNIINKEHKVDKLEPLYVSQPSVIIKKYGV